MFLLDDGKKIDSASTHYNVRDAKTDILTIMQDLAKVVVEERDRHGSPFADPTTRGMEDKAAKGWIESVLQRDSVYEEEDEDQQRDVHICHSPSLFHAASSHAQSLLPDILATSTPPRICIT